MLEIRRTPGSAARTVANKLFAVNYVDRMIRHRVKETNGVCRAPTAGASEKLINQLTRSFFTRRQSVREVGIPESMQEVWLARLESPPIRWKNRPTEVEFTAPAYAKHDLSFADPHGA